jgi:uncharacterized protein (TIGR04222 family)
VLNPFDLRGPAFLVFYTIVGIVTLATVWLVRRLGESRSSDGPMLTDYLEIAYLRGGPGEALRVATMTLINRGLILMVDDQRLLAAEKAAGLVAKASERKILEKLHLTTPASAVLSDPTLKETATHDCEPRLVGLGLLPDDAATAMRQLLLAAAVFVLTAVGATKVLVALSRGRSNIAFLIIEAIVFVVLAFKVTNPPRTPAGNAQMSNLRSLFEGLRDRADSLVPGVESHDVALLAAAFGTAAIPSSFGFRRLFPERKKTSTSSCGGSSCGSSCGGGGCGGGCGGCGS